MVYPGQPESALTIFGLSPTSVEPVWHHAVQIEPAELYTYIGAFICEYSFAELSIDFILHFGLRLAGWDAYTLLTRGMDTRTKIERIKQIHPMDLTVGPQLQGILDRVNIVSRPIRNKIAHSIPRIENGTIYFAELGAMHLEFSKVSQGQWPDRIPAVELRRETLWLRFLAGDIIAALNASENRKIEVIDPLSRLPPGGQGSPLVRARPAKKRKRPTRSASPP